MPPAARVGDPISHEYIPEVGGLPNGTVGLPGGQLLPPMPVFEPLLGVPSVRIGGAPAAVVGAECLCALHAEIEPNVILPALSLGSQVLIGGFPAAREGDKALCQASVSFGDPTVLIGGA
ncbi:PAAR domain-containing protein [Kitasatospora sp. GAS204B]|uniref:PAAR domain-containing protein n=1 Tax=unclassified Kitasatospora TaxID=2633591 RepID=UPI002473742E|nr:PAAR domain-containing protein [Kitasatospora sp. GAS204B]MDH6118867.1 putative Zn-binding protein involved in type VI secretion [Kitasatospora sp. GAS204B]